MEQKKESFRFNSAQRRLFLTAEVLRTYYRCYVSTGTRLIFFLGGSLILKYSPLNLLILICFECF